MSFDIIGKKMHIPGRIRQGAKGIMKRAAHRFRAGPVVVFIYYTATFLNAFTKSGSLGAVRVHCLYVLNRPITLRILCLELLEKGMVEQGPQLLQHVFLRSAWLLQDEKLLDVALEIEQQKWPFSNKSLNFIAQRRFANPAFTIAADQMVATLKSSLANSKGNTDIETILWQLSAFGELDVKKDLLLPYADSAEVCRYLAHQSFYYGAIEEAESWLENASQLDPEHINTYRGLAEAALYQPDPAERFDEILAARKNAGVKEMGHDPVLAMRHILNGDYCSFLEVRDLQQSNAVARQTYGAAVARSMGYAADVFRSDGGYAFVIGRDGISDEVRWSFYYQRLPQFFSRVEVSCDPRLEALFTRSFPEVKFLPVTRNWGRAQVREHDVSRDRVPNLELSSRLDNVSFAASRSADEVMFIEDVPLRSWRTDGVIGPPDCGEPAGNHLIPAPKGAAYWRQHFEQQDNPRLRVGLIWRSGMVDHIRQRHYLALSDFKPLADLPVSLISIQHQVTPEERKVGKEFGIQFLDDEVDFYNDFEGIAALTSQLDLVIGISTLPFELAAAVGTEVWLCAVSPEGMWLRRGGKGGGADRLSRNGHVFVPESAGYLASRRLRVADIMEQIVSRLNERGFKNDH